MTYDPTIHHRRSIRMRGYDYTQAGWYFVTICVRGRRPMFGTVVNGRMALNDAGRMVRDVWTEMPAHYPGVDADAFVVMPDHFHGVVHVGAPPCGCPNANGQPRDGQPRGVAPTVDTLSFPDVVHRFKTLSTTRYINGVAQHAWPRFDGKLWQRNYYEIIVRKPTALANIRAYIRDNPANADVVRYGEPRFMEGNSDLLNLPKTAFLASRGGAAVAPALKPAPACVISGFLSPMERAMFEACLSANIPMVWVLARSLTSLAVPRIRQAIDAGRLLVITPFDTAVTTASARRAAWCNQYVLHAANRVVIGHLSPDGMLACLLADMPDDKPLQTLSLDAEEMKRP